jgi:CRISPR-associated protein Csd1
VILQALNDYYRRKIDACEGALAPEGFELKAIPFVLVLDEYGRLVQLADRREGEGRNRAAKAELVPQSVKKTSGVAANLLWDSAEYVLGVDTKGKPARVREEVAAFRARIDQTFARSAGDAGLQAVLAFLDSHRDQALADLVNHPCWPEILKTNPNLTFQLAGDAELICQRPEVIAAMASRSEEADAEHGPCLVSGCDDVIERLHPAIKGVWGAQTSGANIVSFNLDAFNSYGKTQGFNAQVGRKAAFAYTTALNHLLAKGSRQRVQVGDASTVFWAEKPSGAEFEEAFLDFLGPQRDDPDRGAQAVASLYRCVFDGRPFTGDDGQCFHVLGLAPNAGRISVRFWHAATIAELGQAFYRYFREVEIVRPAWDTGAPLTLFWLLIATAAQGKADNIVPNLAGEVMRAILTGGHYPEALLQGALRRLRAERDVTWQRAALLKACLIRNLRDEEITVSLNEENVDPGYRLGRLFAALERAQERAQGSLNASIRERYYGAFSATPVTVLPLLMKLKNHHLAKLQNRGEAINLEKLLGSIVDGIGDVPARLTLAEQARFAIGYYHQRQAFFSSPDAALSEPTE